VTREVRSLAVLGTGIIGGAMARNLAAAGIETRAWNRTPERAQPLADAGVEVSASPAQAVAGADAVITALADGDAVMAVMEEAGALAAMEQEAIWLQMSTIGVEATKRAAAQADAAGVAFVDAPVIGTKQPAEEGKLIVLASGPDEAIAACGAAFEAVGARTESLGEAGADTRMKLVVNSWLLALTAGLAETLALADRLGVDAERFLEVIAGGPIDAGYAQLKGKAMIERDYPPSFPLRLALKDARLVLAAADDFELPLAQAVEHRLAESVEIGAAEEDMAAIYEAASTREDARPAATA
jgi:3-hydroxyisobutyrate dehydrogenase